MSNTLPIPPSYSLSYLKLWKENSNAFDSWTDFVKDLSLADYTSNTIGQYIKMNQQQNKLLTSKY
jgi:hypothetical protein